MTTTFYFDLRPALSLAEHAATSSTHRLSPDEQARQSSCPGGLAFTFNGKPCPTPDGPDGRSSTADGAVLLTSTGTLDPAPPPVFADSWHAHARHSPDHFDDLGTDPMVHHFHLHDHRPDLLASLRTAARRSLTHFAIDITVNRIRWHLPSLVAILPGVCGCGIDPDVRHLNARTPGDLRPDRAVCRYCARSLQRQPDSRKWTTAMGPGLTGRDPQCPHAPNPDDDTMPGHAPVTVVHPPRP